MGGLQTVIQAIYPSVCVSCKALVEEDFSFCGQCWGEMPFISGLVCEGCGIPLPGAPGPEAVLCDHCLSTEWPWEKGRAAFLYEGGARRLILQLKHGDRMDLARPLARWMVRAARGLVTPETVVVPMPLHWTRLFKRRYNQAALLAHALGQELSLPVCPDMLRRITATAPLDGLGRDARFERLAGTIAVNPKGRIRPEGKHILLVDDVMTSGASFSVAATALIEAGAKEVNVLALARVALDL